MFITPRFREIQISQEEEEDDDNDDNYVGLYYIRKRQCEIDHRRRSASTHDDILTVVLRAATECEQAAVSAAVWRAEERKKTERIIQDRQHRMIVSKRAQIHNRSKERIYISWDPRFQQQHKKVKVLLLKQEQTQDIKINLKI